MANNETIVDTEEVIEEVKEMTEKTDIKINVEVDKKKMEESTKTLEDAFSELKKNGHELARRRWRRQVQAQCVPRSADDAGVRAKETAGHRNRGSVRRGMQRENLIRQKSEIFATFRLW